MENIQDMAVASDGEAAQESSSGYGDSSDSELDDPESSEDSADEMSLVSEISPFRLQEVIVERLAQPGRFTFEDMPDTKRRSTMRSVALKELQRNKGAVDDAGPSKKKPARKSEEKLNIDLSSVVKASALGEAAMTQEQFGHCDATINIKGQSINAVEYISSDTFRRHMMLLETASLNIDKSLPLKTTPLQHQWVGKERLKVLANSDFRGGFLCDAVGLGKSFTSLIAALEIRNDKLRAREGDQDDYRGFILVVAPSGCLRQWYSEITNHFPQEARPKAVILDTPDVSAEFLIQFDVVICSHGFLRSQYQKRARFIAHAALAHEKGLAVADATYEPFTKFPWLPLHSELYQTWGKKISALIIDESHMAKNADTRLNLAIRSLNYNCIFMLTGKPVFNTWRDLAGQLMLLPHGGLFRNLEHFSKLIQRSGSRDMDRPESPRRAVLNAILKGLTIARPKSILNLPPVVQHDVQVSFATSRLSVMKINNWTDRGIRYIRFGVATDGPHWKRIGLSFLRRAQAEAASPLLHVARKISAQLPIDQDPHPYDDNAIREAMEVWHEQRDDKGPFPGIEHLSDEQFEHANDFYQTRSRKRKLSRNQDKPAQDSGVDGAQSPQAQEDQAQEDQAQEDDAEGNSSGSTGSYAEDDFLYPDDEKDATWSPDAEHEQPKDTNDWDDDGSDTEDEDHEGPESDVHDAKRLSRSHPKFKEKWFPFLKEKETQIVSPRVKAILAKIESIRELWPGEKIIVVSEFVLFLDIIKEAIERRSKTDPKFRIRLAEYNGTVHLEERCRIQYAFNLLVGGPEVLLLSAGAGGMGLNLARGTHMIIAEPPWTPGKLDQVIGRTHRLPQDKQVHIWHMRAHPSEIDQFVLDRQAQKVHFVRQLLFAIAGEADTKASDKAVDVSEKALPTHTVYEWAKARAKDVAENERINMSLEGMFWDDEGEETSSDSGDED
ncbi:hypothetical protein H9Q72_002897 [Fusarium xylarioides]|uniref:Uncharacterized protein n=1 Tax=Fusarium xylarioides TaxID=221167 RepID=A0A9P7HYY6_9HYPO|nr:hypothetical protein H9Q72_002897 [Fusarium xylarioides]